METTLRLANPLSVLLEKNPEDFTRADLKRAVQACGIERLTFHYAGLDGQLKELKLPFSSLGEADRILAAGERVDGSSLFKGLVDASVSDLYVVPSYRTAFRSPFDERSLDFVCRFLDRDGNLAPFPPDNVLALAHRHFQERTGYQLHALGELEFFLLGPGGVEDFAPPSQGGYHASSPFFQSGPILDEIVRYLQQITGAVKYAHAEVGFIDSVRSDRPMLARRRGEQHEIEFLTRPIEEMGDHVTLARWIIRNVARRHGMLATFTPKLEEGVAGNGFHVHMELVRDGVNQMVQADGELSEPALRLIGGLARYAPTLSAFGNTVASSFLRLVPNQEAPTRICWSHSNRSSMIRVPLGWTRNPDLARVVNPREPGHYEDKRGRQTVELRSPDGSAQTYLLLAGLTTAAEWGLTSPESLELAARTRVEGNIFEDRALLERLEPLPVSCVACSRLLAEQRSRYEEFGVFPPSLIDYCIGLLARENDGTLNLDLSRMPAEERLTATRQVMHKDLHRH